MFSYENGAKVKLNLLDTHYWTPDDWDGSFWYCTNSPAVRFYKDSIGSSFYLYYNVTEWYIECPGADYYQQAGSGYSEIQSAPFIAGTDADHLEFYFSSYIDPPPTNPVLSPEFDLPDDFPFEWVTYSIADVEIGGSSWFQWPKDKSQWPDCRATWVDWLYDEEAASDLSGFGSWLDDYPGGPVPGFYYLQPLLTNDYTDHMPSMITNFSYSNAVLILPTNSVIVLDYYFQTNTVGQSTGSNDWQNISTNSGSGSLSESLLRQILDNRQADLNHDQQIGQDQLNQLSALNKNLGAVGWSIIDTLRAQGLSIKEALEKIFGGNKTNTSQIVSAINNKTFGSSTSVVSGAVGITNFLPSSTTWTATTNYLRYIQKYALDTLYPVIGISNFTQRSMINATSAVPRDITNSMNWNFTNYLASGASTNHDPFSTNWIESTWFFTNGSLGMTNPLFSETNGAQSYLSDGASSYADSNVLWFGSRSMGMQQDWENQYKQYFTGWDGQGNSTGIVDASSFFDGWGLQIPTNLGSSSYCVFPFPVSWIGDVVPPLASTFDNFYFITDNGFVECGDDLMEIDVSGLGSVVLDFRNFCVLIISVQFLKNCILIIRKAMS